MFPVAAVWGNTRPEPRCGRHGEGEIRVIGRGNVVPDQGSAQR